MKTPTPLTCEAQLGETGDGFFDIRSGVTSYIEGVDIAMSGLKLLNRRQATSLMDNMLVDDQLLDVAMPATFTLETENAEKIHIPQTTWLISQTVKAVLVPNVGYNIESSGLIVSADFDRSDIDENPAEIEFFENADRAFGSNDVRVYGVSVSAFDFIYMLHNPEAAPQLATLTGYIPE